MEGHAHTEVVDRIVGVELISTDPDRLVERLAALTGRAADDSTIALDASTLRVTRAPDGHPDRLVAVDLHTTDPARVGETINLAGVTVRLTEEYPT